MVPAFLEGMARAAGGPAAAAAWEAVLRDSFAALPSISMLAPGWEACLRRLDTVTQPASLRRALAALLTREAAAAASQDGLAFEAGSILGAWPAGRGRGCGVLEALEIRPLPGGRSS